MKIEELSEIVKAVKFRPIKRALKKAGFRNCRWNRRLRHTSLYDIAMAPCDETPSFSDGKAGEYLGILCRNVKGHEEYEFAILEYLAPFKRGGDDISTRKMLIYAKKL